MWDDVVSWMLIINSETSFSFLHAGRPQNHAGSSQHQGHVAVLVTQGSWIIRMGAFHGAALGDSSFRAKKKRRSLDNSQGCSCGHSIKLFVPSENLICISLCIAVPNGGSPP